MFRSFNLALQRQFIEMQKRTLFKVNVDKDLLWETYLNSFPEGTNLLYKTRTEHDCQCCKQFIRAIGNIVTINEKKELVSLWDVDIDNFYKPVAQAMSKIIKQNTIDNIFLYPEGKIGVEKNYQQVDNSILTWDHFHVRLPSCFVVSKDCAGMLEHEAKMAKEMICRSLSEISIDAVDTILDLIGQNSLYRGEEHKFVLEKFKKLQNEYYDFLNNRLLFAPYKKDLFFWDKFDKIPRSVIAIRNSVIGTLLIDISNGRDLEESITSFENKVAPINYKRPTAIVTKGMIEQAKRTIDDLELTQSLGRRFATAEDVSVNNVLFVDREVKKSNNIFDQLSEVAISKPKKLDKIEEVGIEDFIQNILPTARSIEIMFENKHSNNLVSLIAPCDFTAKGMFKWPNPFSWSYAGEMADSIKERVKKAGGNITGDLRCSLSWFNYDDLDLWMYEPSGCIINYLSKRSCTGGHLDVDMNATDSDLTRAPVENICYSNKQNMLKGIYQLKVHNYCKRESRDIGFEVEIEFNGTNYLFSYDKAVLQKETIHVANIEYNRDGFTLVEKLVSTPISKNIWNINTQKFHKVNMILLSPNCWDGKTIGNKHYFFMLNNCLNNGTARGFYNEFLLEQLNPHRKTLEIVGSKTKVAQSDNQLSGLGFSSTQRNSVLCRITGSFTRTVKILF